MAELTQWAFPAELQPDPEQLDFDLAPALAGVVGLRSQVPDDAFTASILGTERLGSGVVIDRNVVLTIGYLVTEAESVWLRANDGRAIQGHVLGFDFATGFGLVHALGQLELTPLRRGSSAALVTGDEVIVVGNGGREHALKTKLTDKREFAGYWEYLLDEALFTSPHHPEWSGAALLDSGGRLCGIGSLLVQEKQQGRSAEGNMFVPIDVLEPILGDLLTTGRARRPVRPWLGMYTTEAQGQLLVGGVASGGPAERAGVSAGDLIIEVAHDPVGNLAELWRRIWAIGDAGVEVPLTVAREGTQLSLSVRSADRADFLRKPALH